MTGSPAILPGHQRGPGLHCVIAAKVRGKPPARAASRQRRVVQPRRWSQPLQPRLIGLLQALLALEQAGLSLQHPFLRALRPLAFRLLRLQLLYALLEAIDAGLPLCALARQHVALPLLHYLLSLLDTLLTLLRTRFDLFLSTAHAVGDAPGLDGAAMRGSGLSRHGRTLWRCGAMDLGSWCYNARAPVVAERRNAAPRAGP